MSRQAQAVVQAQQKIAAPSSARGSMLQRAAVTHAIRSVHHGILQRCSGGVECEECRQKRLEREGMLQRSAVNAAPVNEHVNGVPPIVHEVLSSSGQPLDAGTRAFMEPRFGFDFSGVRVQAAVQERSQTRLAVNEPGDVYEQEADRVSEQVMRMPERQVSQEVVATERTQHARVQHFPLKSGEGIQRRVIEQEGLYGEFSDQAPRLSSELQHRINSMRGGGQALLEPTRVSMERHFGYDFSQVRVHTDAQAAETAQMLNALAYTVGNDVVFGTGQYAPDTYGGQKLLAHELTHVVQQGAVDRLQETRSGVEMENSSPQADSMQQTIRPGAFSIRLVSPNGERFIGPPSLNQTGGKVQSQPPATTEETEQPLIESDLMQPEVETGIRIQRMPKVSRPMLIQRTANFINPTLRPEDPLARTAQGLPPGLTTPTVNGNVVTDSQALATQISPTRATPTGSAGSRVRCQIDRGFHIDTSANMIVASNAGPRGWVGTVPSTIVPNPPQTCAGRTAIPATMNAQPNNADFVTRVRADEQQHADEIRALHQRHFVPYDSFVMSLSAVGANLDACGRSLVRQLGNRHLQAALGFSLGYAAAVQKLDGPGGTHSDTGVTHFADDCSSVSITLSQTTPTIPGSAPGNIVTVAPAVTTFNPTKLRVVGTDIRENSTLIKHFSTAANARRGLQVIQHYGMTSRNVLGPMEYFLVGTNAPSGPFRGANELAINPALYQVTFDVPAPGDWTITETVGNNINVLVNFHTNRNEAYSGWQVMTSFGFTRLCWVGGTRQSPEMLYFRI